jgi:hypothetical protein
MKVCAASLAFVLLGCGGDNSNQGQVGGHCYPNGTCDVGLSCVAGVCLALDAPLFHDAAIDATIDALACSDDSPLEPNDTIQTAFQTPVDTQSASVSFAALAICPPGDKDHYAIDISTASSGIEVIVSWTSGPSLALSLLNAGGAAIANGSPMGANAVRTCAPNLPIGKYYAVAFAGSGVSNNYSLLIRTVAGCI